MLLDLSLSELKEYVKNLGLPSYRADQIFDALYKAKSLEEISNLSKEIKGKIENDYPKYEILKILESVDGTKKMALKLSDGSIVESVL